MPGKNWWGVSCAAYLALFEKTPFLALFGLRALLVVAPLHGVTHRRHLGGSAVPGCAVGLGGRIGRMCLRRVVDGGWLINFGRSSSIRRDASLFGVSVVETPAPPLHCTYVDAGHLVTAG